MNLSNPHIYLDVLPTSNRPDHAAVFYMTATAFEFKSGGKLDETGAFGARLLYFANFGQVDTAFLEMLHAMPENQFGEAEDPQAALNRFGEWLKPHGDAVQFWTPFPTIMYNAVFRSYCMLSRECPVAPGAIHSLGSLNLLLGVEFGDLQAIGPKHNTERILAIQRTLSEKEKAQ